MPAMYIERDRKIGEDEWRRAVEASGARLVAGSLDVEMRDDAGTWRPIVTWIGDGGEFSMLSFCRPFIDPLRAIAKALGGYLIDHDGARY